MTHTTYPPKFLPQPSFNSSDASAFSDISLLDSSHAQLLERGIHRLLGTLIAETTFAQIIDGLPTASTLRESQYRISSDHPVIRLRHDDICKAALEKARAFRAEFDVLSLKFPVQLLLAYRDTTPPDGGYSRADVGKTFHLRLVELVAVACHQIAVHLYLLEAGPHKHSEYQDWRRKPLDRYEVMRLPSAFCHNSYYAVEQYPSSIAECAGYWAEARIFGGVVLFDRGKQETDTFFLHPDSLEGPYTIYAPMVNQYNNLLLFLLHPNDDTATRLIPLPMTASMQNRYRWDPWDAFALYHIYRDPYERVVPSERPKRGCARSVMDFPEDQDEMDIILDHYKTQQGQVISKEGAKRRKREMKQITPSSAFWHPKREYKGVKLEESE